MPTFSLDPTAPSRLEHGTLWRPFLVGVVALARTEVVPSTASAAGLMSFRPLASGSRARSSP